MKDFLLVFRVLYRNRYAVEKESNSGKRRLTKPTVMLLSLLPMVAVICVMLGFAASELTTRYSAMTLLNAILSAVQLFILFMTLPTVMSTLYASEDAAFLASLPLRTTSVFFAKLLLVYISALKIAAVLLLPSMLTVSVTYSAFGNPMFYGFFPLILLIIAAAPLLPLFIVVLFSLPVMWIGSRLKGRATVKTVFSLLFYIVLMAAYMVLVFFINTEGFGQNGNIVSDTALEGLRLLSDVMYPNTVLMSMCLGIDAAVNFGISLAIWAGLIIATVVFAMLFYRRISSRRIEAPAEEGHAAPVYKRRRLVISLVIKDFLTIMRDPSAAMGTFSNIVLAPIVMVVMYFFISGDGDRTMSEFATDMMMRGIVLIYPVIFLCGTNMVAMTAYSREGESFFVAKALPIPAKTSVNAKLLFSLMSSGAALAVIFVLSAALYRIGVGSCHGTRRRAGAVLVSYHTCVRGGGCGGALHPLRKRRTPLRQNRRKQGGAEESSRKYRQKRIFEVGEAMEKRKIGLDVGDVRIGVAVSDLMGICANPRETYLRKKDDAAADAAYFAEYAKREDADAFVLGLPKNMDGTEGPRAEVTRAFGELLNKVSGLPVIYTDERLTTVSAERMLIDADVRRDKRKKVIDKVAATIILQSYLDGRRR